MKEQFDFSKQPSTGNYTIDMIMASIHFYRQKKRPLDTIYLNKKHWREFKEYMASFGEQYASDFDYDFDGVKLKLQMIEGTEEVVFTFFEK